MNNLTLSIGRLAVVLASALTLGACSRADYAATARTSDKPLATSVAAQSPTAPVQAAPYVPVAAEESAVVKASAASPTPLAAAQPAPNAASPVAVTPTVAAAPAAIAPVTAKPAFKPTLVQRLALRKLTKKLDKLTAQAPQFKKQATAARGGLDSNLRSAILFGAVGIIVLLFSSVSGVFTVVGTILLIVGLVFLLLWLLDQA